jgi:hypothetical protein
MVWGGHQKIYKPKHHFAYKNGYVMKHRYVWEQHHKASLLLWAEVHHIDNNPRNNEITNLVAMMSYQHQRLHKCGNTIRRMDMSGRCCTICGSTTTYIKPDGRPKWMTCEEGYMCKSCFDSIYKQNRRNRDGTNWRSRIKHGDDFNKRLCKLCNGKTTADWYKFENSFICRKCYDRRKRNHK